MNNGICQCMLKLNGFLLINIFILLDNPSLCINDTCRGNNDTLLCLHGTINRNNACIRK
jgi:hypothetical protein